MSLNTGNWQGLKSLSEMSLAARALEEAERYERLLDAAHGGRGMRRMIEELHRNDAMIDAAYGGRAMRELIEGYQRLGQDYFALRQGPRWLNEMQEALRQIEQPWKALKESIDASSYLATWQSISSLPWLKTYEDLDRVTRELSSPRWARFADEVLSANGLLQEDLIQRLAEYAEEGSDEDSDESRPSPSAHGTDWKFIIMLLFAIFQTIRAEMLAMHTDKGVLEAERRITLAMESVQQHLLAEIQRDVARREQKRWRATDESVHLRREPHSGAKVARRLEHGIEGIELEHRGKWILLEVDTGTECMIGWALKKRLDRI